MTDVSLNLTEQRVAAFETSSNGRFLGMIASLHHGDDEAAARKAHLEYIHRDVAVHGDRLFEPGTAIFRSGVRRPLLR